MLYFFQDKKQNTGTKPKFRSLNIATLNLRFFLVSIQLLLSQPCRDLLIQRRKHPAQGFTLTEGVVLIVILGIFAALSAPSFLAWLHQKKVDDALAKIEGAIKETQREAIKQGRNCTINLTQGIDQTITGSCLSTGDRVIDEIDLNHSASADPWTITFDFKGRNNNPSTDPGTLWLTIPNSSVQPKCITISVGIGLMRTGNYDGAASIPCTAP